MESLLDEIRLKAEARLEELNCRDVAQLVGGLSLGILMKRRKDFSCSPGQVKPSIFETCDLIDLKTSCISEEGGFSLGRAGCYKFGQR